MLIWQLKVFYIIQETFNKSDDPKISVVIAVYNGEGYIKNAIISIENQNFKDIEIVFIVDFWTDNSTELIKELMKFQEYYYIRMKKIKEHYILKQKVCYYPKENIF